METAILKKINYRTLLIDAIVLSIVYLIPAYSHFLPIPIYFLDPMRVLLLGSYLFTRSNLNSIIMAISLPLFTYLISGHPPLYKAILISIELFVNIVVLIKLLKTTKIHTYVILIISIVFSKVIYYIFKFLFIKLGMLNGRLITTDLWTQATTILIITLLFIVVWRKERVENQAS